MEENKNEYDSISRVMEERIRNTELEKILYEWGMYYADHLEEYEEIVRNILDDVWSDAIEEIEEKQVQKLKDINKEIIDYGDEEWVMEWLAIGVPDDAEESDYYDIITDAELFNDCLTFYNRFQEETKEA